MYKFKKAQTYAQEYTEKKKIERTLNGTLEENRQNAKIQDELHVSHR